MPRQIGLRDIHVALITKDDEKETTYGEVQKLERAINAKLSPKSTSEKLYSEDDVEEIINQFDSCEVEIEVNQLSLKSRALLQGIKCIKGELAEKTNDIAPELAIGFRSLKTNGKYMYVWLYKGKFELNEDEYQTKADKVETKTPKLKATFFGRNSDKTWRNTLDEDETDVDPQRIANWFKTVPEPLSETPVEPEG